MNRPDPYRDGRGFHAALDHRPSWLSIVLGLLAVEAGITLVGTLVVGPAMAAANATVGTLIMMASFAVIGAIVFVLAARVQRRAPATLFGPLDRVLRDALVTGRALFLFFAVLALLPPWDYSAASLNMAPVAWALLLPVSLSVLAIQIGAEEVLYRGWLQQSLARLSPSPILWMGLPSLLFGLGHYSPDLPAAEALSYVIWATFFGLACADLTARTGSLGAALGLHFMTNLSSIVVLSVAGPGDGMALFTIAMEDARPPANPVTTGFDLFYLWMTWMVCRIAIRR